MTDVKMQLLTANWKDVNDFDFSARIHSNIANHIHVTILRNPGVSPSRTLSSWWWSIRPRMTLINLYIFSVLGSLEQSTLWDTWCGKPGDISFYRYHRVYHVDNANLIRPFQVWLLALQKRLATPLTPGWYIYLFIGNFCSFTLKCVYW